MNFRLILIAITLGLAACQAEGNPSKSKENMKSAWVSLAGGCFDMGETRAYREEGPIKEVCLEPFEIWSHEISNHEFASFVKATGYKTRAELGWAAGDKAGPGIDMAAGSAVFVPPKNPQGHNWWTLIDGANWRSPLGPSEGAYNPTAPVVHITRDDAAAYAKWAGGRLPSEAEWEYAARGGLSGKLMSWAEAEEAALEDKANTWQGVFPSVNSGGDGHLGVAPIGSYPANGFGLYDMIGNVWEWTSSSYYPSHQPGEAAKVYPNGYDPAQGDIAVGVIKGGSFLCARSYCFRYRPAARQPQDLIFGTSHIGFRIVQDTGH